MKTLALVTYKGLLELHDSDRLLIEPLTRAEFAVRIISWDEQIDWKQFDIVIIRSCWDYFTRISEFLEWLHLLEQQKIIVWNPLPILLWNYDKTYLKDLAGKGIATIPSVFLEQNSEHDLGHILEENAWDEAVVKPVVGGNAYGVFLVTREQASVWQSKLDDLLRQSGVIIQKFIKEVQAVGEFSIIFIGGEYSHTVCKKPNPGEFRSNIDGKRTLELITLDDETLQQAADVCQAVNGPLLYARVDGIKVGSIFMLMELELLEPLLFFHLFPQGAEIFAHAVKKLSQ